MSDFQTASDKALEQLGQGLDYVEESQHGDVKLRKKRMTPAEIQGAVMLEGLADRRKNGMLRVGRNQPPQ